MGTIDFQFSTRGSKLDFLLDAGGFKMVVDAKYKPRYRGEKLDGRQHQDIRQVSGNAQLRQVYGRLNMVLGSGHPFELINCMIINPEGETKEEKDRDFDLAKYKPIGEYVGVYKCGVKLPILF